MQFTAAILGFVLAFTSVSATPTPVQSSSSLVVGPSSPTGSPGTKFFGDGTYFATGLGSCGKTNKDSDFIVAISHGRMDAIFSANPNNNIQCGKKIKAQHVVDATHPNPPSITVTVEDRCVGCAFDDLDFTHTAYIALGCTDFEGRCKISWEFI
ncbi:hypothetical protein Q9L58_009259 [Maublancomyces gigas]|uniref:RlpA-like protein double-psi beta-barrel domain-containing protein n=1 Tax=Discina gigas TaxID=1032678 RepID=A0ABR3G7E0_9PEZI